jgi:hypothetical protein
MSKVLISYQIEGKDELFEDLWLMRTFGASIWNGKSDYGRKWVYTLALEPEDALLVRLTKDICRTPIVWENRLDRKD